MMTGVSSLNLRLRDPVHCLPYRVLYADTDTGGVVYYGSYLRMFEMGRTEYLRDVLGVSYNALQRDGIIFPVHEAYCRYTSPARYDDLLAIHTSLDGFTKASLRFHYEITLGEEKRTIARGFTVHASVDRSGRLARMPETLIVSFQKVFPDLSPAH
ncbi:MAG: acyl-CoA thioesterase [Deltaproteobacteria bacterium]